MEEDYIIEVWDIFKEYISDKNKEIAANHFVDFLVGLADYLRHVQEQKRPSSRAFSCDSVTLCLWQRAKAKSNNNHLV
jgi:hypothetical protein